MNPPHRDEHQSAKPGLSPGVVRNDEQLLRSLFDPDHIEKGVLLERAISLEDLSCRGFSTHRMHYTNRETVERSNRKILRGRFDGNNRTLAGTATLQVNQVRALQFECQQAFVVIDTALIFNRWHSSIYAKDKPFSKGRLRGLRRLLMPLIQSGMSAEDPFDQ